MYAFFLVNTIYNKTILIMLKNVNTLKLINLKLVLYCFLPYLCIIIKGVIKIPYSLTTKKKTKNYEN